MASKLDRALSTYSSAEPLTGLEQRVLQNASATKIQRRTSYWAYALALGCAALILLICVFPSPRTTQPKPTQPKSTFETAIRHRVSSPPAAIPQLASARRPKLRRRKPGSHRQPQPNQEELLLARYIAADPEEAAKTLASLNQPTQPITIQPINIEPLSIKKGTP